MNRVVTGWGRWWRKFRRRRRQPREKGARVGDDDDGDCDTTRTERSKNLLKVNDKEGVRDGGIAILYSIIGVRRTYYI